MFSATQKRGFGYPDLQSERLAPGLGPWVLSEAPLLHMVTILCKRFPKLLNVICGLKWWLSSLMFSWWLVLPNPKYHYSRSLCQCCKSLKRLDVVSLLITSVNLSWGCQASVGISFSPTCLESADLLLFMPLLSPICLAVVFVVSLGIPWV